MGAFISQDIMNVEADSSLSHSSLPTSFGNSLIDYYEQELEITKADSETLRLSDS